MKRVIVSLSPSDVDGKENNIEAIKMHEERAEVVVTLAVIAKIEKLPEDEMVSQFRSVSVATMIARVQTSLSTLHDCTLHSEGSKQLANPCMQLA